MTFNPEACRSLLFVPAGNDRYLASALRGKADAILLDLEDAIPSAEKERAREAARSGVAAIHGAGRVALVRVNAPLRLLARDLEVVAESGLAGLVVPKVETGEFLKLVDGTVTELEVERGIARGQIRLIAQIETALGLLNAREIAVATPRLAAMGVGSEDLAADLGGRPDPDMLYLPNLQALIAARAAGITPLGYVGSIAVYDDPETYRGWIRRARGLGFEGAFCIHPNQVEILNAEFSPSDDEVEGARDLVAAYEARLVSGSGAFSHKGRMVDAPVVERARRLLRRREALR